MRLQWFEAGVLVAAFAFAPSACGDADGSGPGGQSTTTSGAGGDGGEGGAGGAGGGVFDPELDESCTPTVTVQLEDTGPKGEIFTSAVPDPEAFLQETGRTVCRILYRDAEEVRDANHITLIIRDDPDYPGWKSGDVGKITVMISSDHLTTVLGNGGDVLTEITGILLHEMTHMYQRDDKAPGEGSYPTLPNIIEGIADFVRVRAGYPPAGSAPSKTGAWDDAGYWKPAYFLLWIDGLYADFLYRLNLSMEAGDGMAWSPSSIATITGKSVDQLWAEFAGATCCTPATQACCS